MRWRVAAAWRSKTCRESSVLFVQAGKKEGKVEG